jgi:hypothetical protein
MSTSDYVIDILLIAIVVRQLRPRELTLRSMILPLVLAGVACVNYLRPITLVGNDLAMIVLLTLVGAALGVTSGMATAVWLQEDGQVACRAGTLAALAWVAGMGFRFAFAIYSTHSGASTVARFSRNHDITSAQAYVTALVLMAVAEVVARTAVLQLRRVASRWRSTPTPPSPGNPDSVGDPGVPRCGSRMIRHARAVSNADAVVEVPGVRPPPFR